MPGIGSPHEPGRGGASGGVKVPEHDERDQAVAGTSGVEGMACGGIAAARVAHSVTSVTDGLDL